MGNMTIPEQVQKGLEKLQILSDDSEQTLLDALKAAKPSLSVKDLASHIVIPAVETDDILEIVASLVSLYSYRHIYELTPKRTVEDVVTSDSLKMPAESRKTFATRLAKFLDNIEALSITAKAGEVMFAHERTLAKARIFTDMRPVFKDDSADAVAAVIIHTLQIVYREGRQQKEFYVALDTQDVADLKKILDRADAKAERLEQSLDSAKLLHIEANHEV